MNEYIIYCKHEEVTRILADSCTETTSYASRPVYRFYRESQLIAEFPVYEYGYRMISPKALPATDAAYDVVRRQNFNYLLLEALCTDKDAAEQIRRIAFQIKQS